MPSWGSLATREWLDGDAGTEPLPALTLQANDGLSLVGIEGERAPLIYRDKVAAHTNTDGGWETVLRGPLGVIDSGGGIYCRAR